MRNPSNVASALDLFDDGYAIFPCAENTKIPLVPWTTEYATERDQVADWWLDWPDDNIGINCKESNLLVVDPDGPEGIADFEALWFAHEDVSYWEYTRVVATPHDGEHVWFDMPALPLHNTSKQLTPHVDTRGWGGQALAPGSCIDGRPYRYISDRLPARLPGWLEKQLRALEIPFRAQFGEAPDPWPRFQAEMMLREVPRRIAAVLPGRRNDVLNREAFRLRRAIPALGPEAVYDALWEAAGQNGLLADRDGEVQTRRTIRSGLDASTKETIA